MCLRNISDRIDPPDQTERIGYRVVTAGLNTWVGAYLLPHYSVGGSGAIEFNQWYTARHVPVPMRGSAHKIDPDLNSSEVYMSGFHIFTTIEEARRCWIEFNTILEVRYRGTRIIGWENTRDGLPLTVVVADEIMFVKEVGNAEASHSN